jgi:hypothetical protein
VRILKKKSLTRDKKATRPAGHDAPMNRAEFSKRSGLSTGTISNKRDAGLVVCVSGSPKQGAAMKIDPWPSVKNLLAERASQPEADRSSVAREQAERLRIGNMRERGELLDAALVDEALKAAIAGLLQDWDALAQRITTDETIQAAIATECRGAQARFAQALGDLSAGFRSRAAEAAKDGGRMG